MRSVILGLLLALASPIFLLPTEKFLPFPYIIEEAVKLMIVIIIIRAEKASKKHFAVSVLAAGLLFTLSESILYLINILDLGDFSLFPQRLLLTGSMHLGTIALIYFLGRKSYFGLLIGFSGAVIIHYLYNLWASGL